MTRFNEDDLIAWVADPNQDDLKAAKTSLAELIAERDELIKERDELIKERADALDAAAKSEDAESDLVTATDALETVRYWFHDLLFLKKPIQPPARILRVVDEAMGL